MSKKKKPQNINPNNSIKGEKKNIKETRAASSPASNLTPKDNKQVFYLGLAAILIAFLTFFAYQPALDNEFVDWDDYAYVIDNDLVRSKKAETKRIFSEPISLNYHPLTILTMQWNNNECPNCINKISARPFILWNIILHILNSILVLIITFQLSKKSWLVAAFSAAVFALHPMHVESVAWVSERKDVLYVFFFLAGMLTYNRYLDGYYAADKKADNKWLIFTFILFFLSCISKAMGVVFPVVMILMDFWRNPKTRGWVALRDCFKMPKLIRLAPFLALAVFFGMMAISVQSGGDFGGLLEKKRHAVAINEFNTFSIFQRFQFAAYGFCAYIYKFFVPTNLCTFYAYPTQPEFDKSSVFIASFIFFIAILSMALFSLRSTKIYAFGMGFYLITVALVLQFLSVGVVIMADRYTYLPYVGFAFILGYLADKLPQQFKYGAYAVVAIASVVWILQTKQQVDVWQNSDTLWSRVIAIYPNQEQPYSIRGNYYGKMASYYQSKGDTAQQRQYMDKAFNDFQAAIQLNSQRADVYEGLGNIYGMRGNAADGMAAYTKAIQLNPNKATVYINRGISYSMLGDLKASLRDMEKAVELEALPMNFLYRGMARRSNGDIEGAKADFRQCLQLEPSNAQAQQQLKELGG